MLHVVDNNSSSSDPNLLIPDGNEIPLDANKKQPSTQYQPKGEQQVNDLILRDEEYLKQTVLSLFDRQEDDEKARHKTIHRNGIGFNAADASIFTPIAERLRSGHSLSPDELAACRKPAKNGKPRLTKYWRQLLNVANRGGVQ